MRRGAQAPADPGPAPDPAEAQRLDKWLVVARFVKTRGRAADLVEDGRVRLAGRRVSKPDQRLRPGDVLTLALPHATLVVRVRAAAARRGASPQARELYEEVAEDGAAGEGGAAA